MKITLSLLFILLFLTSIAQEENRQAVPGTKISLVPPPGFVAAVKFSGFQQEASGASIMVNELPGPVQPAAASFTASSLQAKGLKLIEKKTVDWNNSKATLIKASQPANGTTYIKLILIFGDAQKTILINGIYPESAQHLEPAISASLLSGRYDEQQNDDPLAAAPFSIDASGSGLSFAKYFSGTLLYTADGKVPTESADKAMMTVAGSLGAIVSGDRKQFAIDRLKKLPRGEFNEPKETNPVTIAGLEGFEIIADGKDVSGKKQLVYQVMLFTAGGEYYILAGSAIARFDTYLPAFKKMANTFTLK